MYLTRPCAKSTLHNGKREQLRCNCGSWNWSSATGTYRLTGWQVAQCERTHDTKFLVWERFRVHDSRVSLHCQKALESHLHKGRSQCKNDFISGLSMSHNSALHALLLFGGYHVICHRLLLNIICFWLNLLQKGFLHKCK